MPFKWNVNLIWNLLKVYLGLERVFRLFLNNIYMKNIVGKYAYKGWILRFVIVFNLRRFNFWSLVHFFMAYSWRLEGMPGVNTFPSVLDFSFPCHLDFQVALNQSKSNNKAIRWFHLVVWWNNSTWQFRWHLR